MPSSNRIADATPSCRSCGRPGGGSSGQPGRPPLDERRAVTVLFVDIVGFTTLVDDLEPEEVRDLQRAYFSVVARIIRDWHGVVEKYIGDAVMAVFGARDGDGYDAYRAVRAGLAVQEALTGQSLAGRFLVRARVGVATGDAIVDLGAIRDGGDAMISGSVVALAARLQAYAPDGTVVVCGYTRHSTASVVAYQDLPPIAVAGKPRPIDLWRALPSRAVEPGTAGSRRHVETA